MDERLGIAGSGAIACGLAVTAAGHGDVVLWARSQKSEDRARANVEKLCAKLEGHEHDRIRIVRDLDALHAETFVVEAVVEEHEPKAAVLAELAEHTADDAILSTTTSSLSISALAEATGRSHTFVGLHVFNPVPRMKLVELVFPSEADQSTRDRSYALCETLGKTAVEVPDIPGFVVNRLLFPYLFSAAELMAETGLSAKDVDNCMTLGAGMPMGPLALLDFVGLDVSQAIGEAIGATIPESLEELVRAGSLGRKTGQGFYNYD